MIKIVRQLWQERKYNIREDEVLERLSFNVWKTCNRILEEVEGERRINREPLPVPSRKSYLYDPKLQTRMCLSRNIVRSVLELKYKSELPSGEMAWASQADSNADREEEDFRVMFGRRELAFYRLIGGNKRKVPDKAELADQHVMPVIIK